MICPPKSCCLMTSGIVIFGISLASNFSKSGGKTLPSMMVSTFCSSSVRTRLSWLSNNESEASDLLLVSLTDWLLCQKRAKTSSLLCLLCLFASCVFFSHHFLFPFSFSQVTWFKNIYRRTHTDTSLTHIINKPLVHTRTYSTAKHTPTHHSPTL